MNFTKSFFFLNGNAKSPLGGENINLVLPEKPFLVPRGQWMKGSILYCSEKLGGAQGGKIGRAHV